jgi:hypothetical protein
MLSGRDTFSGEVVNVHGVPYSFERRLGSGGFGNINLIVNMKFLFSFDTKNRFCIFSKISRW